MNLKHKIVEHIDFMYKWMFRLYMHEIHEFYIKQQMKIILNSLLEEWNQVRQSLKDILNALDFNSLAEKMLLERERLYTIMGIRRTGRSVRKLDPAAKFIPWFDKYKVDGLDADDVDDIIGDLNYVPTF